MSPNQDRQLLERSGKVRLWAEPQGRRTIYLVQSPEGSWTYNLLWGALSKFDRIVRSQGRLTKP
jgi:hypothetical protein